MPSDRRAAAGPLVGHHAQRRPALPGPGAVDGHLPRADDLRRRHGAQRARRCPPIGGQPPAPSWGTMLNAAQRYLVQAPWMAIYPGLMIFAVVMALNVLGDALRSEGSRRPPRGAPCSTPPSATWSRRRGWPSTPG